MLGIIIKFKKLAVALIMGAMLLGIGIGIGYNKPSEVNGVTEYSESDIVVALDAGHYKGEPGKRSPYDSFFDYQKTEIEYNIGMVRLVEKKLQEKAPHIKIYLTNPKAENQGRSQRAVQSYKNKADLLVSLHMNAIGDEWQEKINGVCICVSKNASIGTKKIAQDFVDEYSERTNIPKVATNGIYERGSEVGLLDKSSQLNLPALLVEMEFMDNYKAYRNFSDPNYLDMVADVISDCIINSVENLK